MEALRKQICKRHASDVLKSAWVEAPDEIDLELLAWQVGRLQIEYGQLNQAEGRLVASSEGGVIRISDQRSLGRQRFTIAHEIGHFKMHGPVAFDILANLREWASGSKETEANVFAVELLMPEFLFKPQVVKKTPSLALTDSLAEAFRCSRIATSIHFLEYTLEPCALVYSKDGVVTWTSRSPSFDFFIYRKASRLHPFSAAGEIRDGKYECTHGMVDVPAGAWLENYNAMGKELIFEDSRLLSYENAILSLLWVSEEI